jgi:hypothetical protein
MFVKKTMAALALVAIATTSSAFGAYEEIECSADAVFAANSCSQCFTGGAQSTGANIGLLSDLWVNTGNTDQLVYKEEQEMPTMLSLGGATWSQTPSAENFWEYTNEFNSLYSETEDAFVLTAGEKVNWIKSKLGYAYKLDQNPAAQDDNIGLLVYTLITHALTEGIIDEQGIEHKECVLFTSNAGEAPVVTTPETPEEPKRLPETGAEHVLLLMIALLLGFGFFKFRKQA